MCLSIRSELCDGREIFGRSERASVLSSQERTEDSHVFGRSQCSLLAGQTYIRTSLASLAAVSRVSSKSIRTAAIYHA